MKQARYVTIHMENDPYALGMSGPNTPIHHLPAVVAPHPAGSTIPGYTRDDLRTLHPMYTQRLDINNAMRRTRDNGLMAEVHRYCNLVDEQAQKQAEVDRLNDQSPRRHYTRTTKVCAPSGQSQRGPAHQGEARRSSTAYWCVGFRTWAF